MQTTDLRSRIGVAIILAFALLALGCSADEEPLSLAGTYELDRQSYLKGLLAEGEAWAQSESADRTPETRETLLAEMREKAGRRAEHTGIRLDLAADGSFELQIESEDQRRILGRGMWRREGKRLTLHTDTVEIEGMETPDEPELPPGAPRAPKPPPITAEIDGDTLVVQPSPGVPFLHRLVRAGPR